MERNCVGIRLVCVGVALLCVGTASVCVGATLERIGAIGKSTDCVGIAFGVRWEGAGIRWEGVGMNRPSVGNTLGSICNVLEQRWGRRWHAAMHVLECLNALEHRWNALACVGTEFGTALEQRRSSVGTALDGVGVALAKKAAVNARWHPAGHADWF